MRLHRGMRVRFGISRTAVLTSLGEKSTRAVQPVRSRRLTSDCFFERFATLRFSAGPLRCNTNRSVCVVRSSERSF